MSDHARHGAVIKNHMICGLPDSCITVMKLIKTKQCWHCTTRQNTRGLQTTYKICLKLCVPQFATYTMRMVELISATENVTVVFLLSKLQETDEFL